MNTKRIKYVFILAILIWTLIITFLVIFEMIEIKRDTNELIKTEAQANFNKDQAIRHWVASHGGIYVPIDSLTPASQYLSHIEDRDIETKSGKQLTLMNPAYMIRQLNEYFTEYYGVVGHITSLKLLRPENKPDDWERNALEQFENGITEISEYDTINGEPYYRLIQPMKVTQNCLKCHAHQNYKVGEIRGSVAVSIPAKSYYERALTQKKHVILIFGLLWSIVSTLILFAHHNLKKQIKIKEKAKEKIRTQNIEIEKKNEQLKIFNLNLENKVKERTKELRKSEKKYRVLSNNAIMPIVIHDINGNIKYLNNSALKTMKANNVQKALKTPIINFVHLDYIEEITNTIKKLFENEKEVFHKEQKFIRFDGEYIDVDVFGKLIEYNNEKAIQLTFNDITERKKAEQALKENEAYLQAVISSLSDLMFIIDKNGIFIDYNQPDSKIDMLMPAEKFIGKTL